MKYPHLLARLRSSRWGIQPASLQAIYDSLGAHLRGHLPAITGRALSPEVAASLMPMPGAAAPVPAEPPSPVAVISIYGIIGKHLSSLETMCGGCDLDEVEDDICDAMADDNVKAIILDFDSPGGVVTGVPELADKIRAWSAQKPIYGFTESLCASAAYWLASGCKQIATTATADIGSIGVYIALVDDSEWWKKEGYKLELIKAGDYKAMGISGKPLSDAERALLQSDVDTIYGMFTSDVVAGRAGAGATVESAAMQGQTFLGQAAVNAGLADGVVIDLASFVLAVTEEVTPKPAA